MRVNRLIPTDIVRLLEVWSIWWSALGLIYLGLLPDYLNSHHNPLQCHWIALLHVLKYVRGTAAYELCYRQCEKDLRLTGYSDSDWASSAEDRRSTSGYCFSLTEEGPLISWRSRKQPAVALSTCEAQYIALAAAVALALVIMIKIICLWSLRIIRAQLL